MAGPAAMSFLLQQQLQHKWRCSAISESLVNGQVRFREVRLIGTDGEQLGIMSSQDALKIAEEAELDWSASPRWQNRLSARSSITGSIAMR